MPILVIVITISLMFYLFYKVLYFRSKRPMERKWIGAKSTVALGLFVACFGFNRLLFQPSTVSIVVGIIFLLLGSFNIWGGIKEYKHYLPLAAKEAANSSK